MYGGSDSGLFRGVGGLWDEFLFGSNRQNPRAKRCLAPRSNGTPVLTVGRDGVRSWLQNGVTTLGLTQASGDEPARGKKSTKLKFWRIRSTALSRRRVWRSE